MYLHLWPPRRIQTAQHTTRLTLTLCLFIAGWLAALSPYAVRAQQPVEVAFAGFAYAGAENTIKTRYPRSQQYEEAAAASGAPVFQRLVVALKASPPTSLRIIDQIDELKGRDQALAVAMVVGSETVISERFGGSHKLTVLIRAQAMFFDFKSMTVLRSYPLSFAYLDLLNHPPTEAEIRDRVKLVYEGANDKPGLLSRFATSVTQATIPRNVPRYMQVTSARIAPEVMEALPAALKAEPGTAQNWLADIVGESISTRTGIPIVPYAKGYAVGNVMSMRVSDGRVWELTLPQPDYEVTADLTALKKIKFSEVTGGATTFVYGAYAELTIEDALKKGLHTTLKNGETRVIPASQSVVDDFPHFYDAINGLFNKIALAIDGHGDEKWVKTAAGAKDIDQQLIQAKEIIKLCK